MNASTSVINIHDEEKEAIFIVAALYSYFSLQFKAERWCLLVIFSVRRKGIIPVSVARRHYYCSV